MRSAAPRHPRLVATRITSGPGRKARTGRIKFRFTADESGSTFECALDRKKPKPCASPFKKRRVKPGRHPFRVRAIDRAGNRGPLATKRFKVKRRG